MPSVPMQSAAAQTLLALVLGIRMTAFRGQSFSQDGVLQSAAFDKWSKAQTNSAEYHGIFISMCALLGFGCYQSGVEPSTRTNLACALSAISSYLFAIGVVLGKSAGANPTGKGKNEQPHPLRALGALGRYISMALMAYEGYKLSKKMPALRDGNEAKSNSAQAMNKKPLHLAAIDLDGTLLRSDGSVSDRSRSALQSFEALPGSRGVVLASGQPPSQLLRNLKNTGLQGCNYCIASGGATVLSASTGQIEYRDWVSAPALSRLIPQIRDKMPELRLTIESENAWVTSNMDFFTMLDRLMPGTGSKLAKIGKEQPRLEDALGEGKITQAVKLLMLHSDDSKGSTDRLIAKLKPLIEQENRQHGSGLDLTSPGGGEGAVQLTPAGVDKAKALKWICGKLGVEHASVVAFGDHVNDNAMLGLAGLGVAVGNAIEETKRCADEVTATNDEDGVALVLERIVSRGKP